MTKNERANEALNLLSGKTIFDVENCIKRNNEELIFSSEYSTFFEMKNFKKIVKKIKKYISDNSSQFYCSKKVKIYFIKNENIKYRGLCEIKVTEILGSKVDEVKENIVKIIYYSLYG